jgi:hypothetical protein
LARALDDWLNAYLKYSENSEPPQSYHIWTGIGVLAGALQRKVYMHWGRSTIYPNLYIVLVGPSGRARKGTALEYGKPLLKGVGAKVIEGAITREKLIRRMGDSVTNFADDVGNPRFQCATTCISDELSVFLGQGNIKFLADLCNWYDCPEQWVYDTKGQGTDKLEGVCFNLIGATAPDWLPSILPQEARGGGFTSRTVFVVEEDKGKVVPIPKYDTKLEKILYQDLERIFLLSGEFKFTKKGLDYYVNWYEEQEKEIARGNPPVPDPKMAGYCERRATLLRKLSIIVSVSEGDSRNVGAAHIRRALDLLIRVEKKMPRVFSGLGQARYALATEILLNFIVKHKTVTRSQVLKFFFRDIDSYTFEVAVQTLIQMGTISAEVTSNPSDMILKLKDKIEPT